MKFRFWGMRGSMQRDRAARVRSAADLKVRASEAHREWLERKTAEETARLERDRHRLRLEDVDREIGQVEQTIEAAQTERDRLLRVECEFEQIEAAIGHFGWELETAARPRRAEAAASRMLGLRDSALDEPEPVDPLAEPARRERASEVGGLIRRYPSGRSPS